MPTRRRSHPLLAFASIALASFAGAFASPAQAAPSRIEVHPFATVTMTAAQMLAGDTAGAAATIAAELRLPDGGDARVPAVVFLHGDAGAIANQPPWIEQLNAMGVAVFTVDGFTGRGAVSETPGVGPIRGAGVAGPTARTVDAYRALALLARHPRIDPKRIVAIGVSSGGRAALNAAMVRFRERHATSDARFAGFIALYPPCNVELVDDDRLDPGPLRIFIGDADNVTAAGPCRDYVERLRRAGSDADLTVYAGAFHGFDNPPGTPMTHRADVASSARCRAKEIAGGRIVNVDTNAPLTDGDACITHGFDAGRDAAADAAVRAAVRDLLRTWFGLPAR